jgi:predicted ferric reductase
MAILAWEHGARYAREDTSSAISSATNTPAHSQTATSATASANASDIDQYATGLTGVNQDMNDVFRNSLWWSMGLLAILILIFRLRERMVHHMRHMQAMNKGADEQAYWRKNTTRWWKIKKHILYAPLGKKRHNREFQLSSAMNMGTLPSRFHFILLAAYVVSNLAYCAVLDYRRLDHYSVLAELRGRSGSLAVVNMIALVIFAGRNNPLISLLQISFDTYNLLHRWVGRVIVLESLIHTLAWALVKHAATGWPGVAKSMTSSPFLSWGTVGTSALVLILVTSFSPVRHAFYETFLNVHIILAFTTMLAVYLHCDISKLPQLPYIQAVICLWAGDRFARMARLVYCNWSPRNGWTNATITALPGGATRVTMHLPKYLDIKPGTHAYLRFARLNAWESHPFSIAWHDHILNPPTGIELKARMARSRDAEAAIDEPPVSDASNSKTDVSFIIHSQTGLTKRLNDTALTYPSGCLTLKAALEGPYAGHHSLDSYGHLVLFAGSSGITHQISYLRHLIDGMTNKTIATRKVCLIWIVRESDHLEWVRAWMDLVLQMPGRREILSVKIYITKPKNPKDIHSPSATVEMFSGRPNIPLIMEEQCRNQVGAMAVTVCGPGGLADNVRDAVRAVQHKGNVSFIEESFTW